MGVERGDASRVALPGIGASKGYWVKTRKWPAVLAVDAGLWMAARLDFFLSFTLVYSILHRFHSLLETVDTN